MTRGSEWAAANLGHIDRESDTPRFEQIRRLLRDAITSRQLAPGDRLPTETAMAAHFGVARTTLRRAVQELRTEGLLVSASGRGVAARPAPGITESAAQGSKMLVFEKIAAKLPSPEEADALGIAADTPVLTVSRRVTDATGSVVSVSDSVFTSTYVVEYHGMP